MQGTRLLLPAPTPGRTGRGAGCAGDQQRWGPPLRPPCHARAQSWHHRDPRTTRWRPQGRTRGPPLHRCRQRRLVNRELEKQTTVPFFSDTNSSSRNSVARSQLTELTPGPGRQARLRPASLAASLGARPTSDQDVASNKRGREGSNDLRRGGLTSEPGGGLGEERATQDALHCIQRWGKNTPKRTTHQVHQLWPQTPGPPQQLASARGDVPSAQTP